VLENGALELRTSLAYLFTFCDSLIPGFAEEPESELDLVGGESDNDDESVHSLSQSEAAIYTPPSLPSATAAKNVSIADPPLHCLLFSDIEHE